METHSDSSSTGSTFEQCLKLVTELLQQSQEMISGNVPMSLRFNHRQCKYLVKKLETAVQSALNVRAKGMSLSMSSTEQAALSMRNLKFLVRLALDIKIFIQECCEEKYWIQAASVLMNAFEHVALLRTDLELCIWSNENRNRVILGTDLRLELTRISEAQDRILRDQVNLLKRVDNVLNSENVSNPEARELATSLLEEFEKELVIHTNSDKPELAKLCFCDQVNLLNTVAVALNSGIISNPEECQLATSRVDRFRAAVANPISDENHSGFLRVYECKSIKQENLLGKGSFGDVYKVKWLGIPAAEKTLPEESAQVDFDQEVSILARLSHPSIVRLLCYMKERVKCSIILELMDKDLTALIKGRMEQDGSRRGFPFSTAEAVDILLQLAEGMDYLHRRRVLHRDLKPANILVKCVKLVGVELVHAKVADFGISKTKERSITIHHPTWNRGTTRWMAPELIRVNQYQNAANSDNNVDNGFAMYPFLSDVFSFGMVCYELLTGNVPFAGVSLPNIVKKMITEGVRPPLPPHCPPGLASMTKKCWRAEPKERPSFAEICRELRFMKGSLLIGRNL